MSLPHGLDLKAAAAALASLGRLYSTPSWEGAQMHRLVEVSRATGGNTPWGLKRHCYKCKHILEALLAKAQRS